MTAEDANRTSKTSQVKPMLASESSRLITSFLGSGIQFQVVAFLPESLAHKADELEFSFIGDNEDVWQSLGNTSITPLPSMTDRRLTLLV